jgi:hypothetical protein
LVLVVAVLSCLYGNSLYVVPTPPIRQAKTHSDYTDHYAYLSPVASVAASVASAAAASDKHKRAQTSRVTNTPSFFCCSVIDDLYSEVIMMVQDIDLKPGFNNKRVMV